MLTAAMWLPAGAGAQRVSSVPAPAGSVLERHLIGEPPLRYFLYVPRSAPARGAPLLVTVHGISRNARQHARMFAPLAERYGVVLVAPLFDADRFPDYQRLGRRGGRPDLVLADVLRDVQADTGAATDKIFLFGYSGGGQFVHRFAMAYPQRVQGYVVGASGWYTLPDPGRRFPYGTLPAPELPELAFDPARFTAVRGSVVVGERDVHQGTALRKSRRVEKHQGRSRVDRARRWVSAMNESAMQHGNEPDFTLTVLPRSGHSFSRSMRRGAMGEIVFRRLFGEPPEYDILMQASALDAVRTPVTAAEQRKEGGDP
ncbi:MAG TPA: PHB depolymerase family esterase [Pelomicrobium sp.]|nr:PHB depolymerase family esterase [Pelomicrobium sp.]